MVLDAFLEARKPASKRHLPRVWSEATAWETVGSGWRPLNGDFHKQGFSVEWHDFQTKQDLDWSRSFHPGSVEICLNLAGRGEVRAGRRVLELTPATAGYYAQSDTRLAATRCGGERHQFITIELSLSFLARHVPSGEPGLDQRVKKMFARRASGLMTVSEPVRLTSELQQLILSLRRPPVYAAAQPLWYQAKALELAAALLYQPLPGEELFCERHKRVGQERVAKVVSILKRNLAEPPRLEEIGREVGCSHYYLSRIFTQAMGKTISAYLRDLRMESAAELLRGGRLNVTEVALEVGYSSLSHFSAAFHAAFGCCPGLYPIATPAQKAVAHAIG